MKNILFIFGNGFDLQCQLKTRFSDFFMETLGGEIYNKFSNNLFDTRDYHFIEIVNYFDDKTKSFDWFSKNLFSIMCLFHMHELIRTNTIETVEINWFDVETYLFEFVKSNRFLLHHYLEELIRQLTNIRQKQDTESQQLKEKSQWITPQNIKSIYEISKKDLLKSVQNFEWQFNNYIIESVKCYDLTNTYIEEAGNLFSRILSIINLAKFEQTQNGLMWKVVPLMDTGKINIYILNFNYTNPFIRDGFKTPYKIGKEHVSNIHGAAATYRRYTNVGINGGVKNITLENAPPCIIGIDDTLLKYNNSLYEFSKSFKISSRMLNVENTIHTNPSSRSEFVLPPQHEPLDIIIYGHSLNDNDYSYFHSIFDRYDLCNNPNVRIIVCYSKDSKTLKPYLDFHDAYNLIKKYGSSLLNTEQGKNLFSRLILERRLLLREV